MPQKEVRTSRMMATCLFSVSLIFLYVLYPLPSNTQTHIRTLVSISSRLSIAVFLSLLRWSFRLASLHYTEQNPRSPTVHVPVDIARCCYIHERDIRLQSTYSWILNIFNGETNGRETFLSTEKLNSKLL